MKQKILPVFLLIFLYPSSAPALARGSSALDLSLGLGYDNVSERYYLVHSDTVAVPPESLEVLRRTTEEVEEQKAILRFNLGKDFTDHSRFSVSNRFSLGNLYLRDILRMELKNDWLMLSNQAELKTIQDKEKVTYQTDYFTNSFDVKLKARLSPELVLRFKNSLEYTEYRERKPYTYDYCRNRTSLELDTDISSDSFLRLSYQFSKRYVPDSSWIDYDGHFFDVSLDKYFDWGTFLQLENELERKTFNKPGGVDDFWNDRLTAGLSKRLHDRLKLLYRNEFEVLSYDIEDEINFDYLRAKISASLEYEISEGLEVACGPEWMIFSSVKRVYQDYDYTQPALSLSLDLSRSTRLWLSAEDKFGRRNYKSDENPFYTDYLLNQWSCFLNTQLNSHLGFHLLLSVDSEWHDSKGDNLTVYLVSGELTYSF